MRNKFSALVFLASLSVGAASMARAASVDVIEYFHAGFGHYFITGSAAEAAALDAGKLTGWVRTGQTFKAHSSESSGDSTVCRFFSTSFAPKSSHFYTPYASECDTVKLNPNWQYEGTAFYIQAPAPSGVCPIGTEKVFRLYNNGKGGAPNHRYTTSTSTRAQMIGEGWVSEGPGADGVGFCAEVSGGGGAPSDSEQTRKMLGGTWTFVYVSNFVLYQDAFVFSSVISDPGSATPYYAQGLNRYGLPTTAGYNTSTAQMELRSPFPLAATDYFAYQYTSDNSVSGCYFFLPTSSSTPTCISFFGTRK